MALRSLALVLALALALALPASPEASAAEPGSPAMAGELQRHFDGMLERDGMREYAEEHPAPLLADGGLDPRFRVHKRSPFGSGNDHTVGGGLDCEVLPAVKPQRYVDPYEPSGVQFSGALVQLLEMGFGPEDSRAALAATANDIDAAAAWLRQRASESQAAWAWPWGSSQPQSPQSALVLEERTDAAPTDAAQTALQLEEEDAVVIVDDEEEEEP